MQIHSFKRDILGMIFATVKHNGKDKECLIWSQGDDYFVVTGAKITKDFERHNFSRAQLTAFQDFKTGEKTEIYFNPSI